LDAKLNIMAGKIEHIAAKINISRIVKIKEDDLGLKHH
jgi:hypothetical protein